MTWSPPKNYTSRPIAILGGGVLGRRIAACFASVGWHVIIRDPSEKSRADAVAYIDANMTDYLTISHGEKGSWEATEDFGAAVKDAWLVFEAVPEILSIKEDTFLALEKQAPADCILASNSSSFMSRELLGKVKESTKARVLNTHFMMPPQALIVELMTSGSTASNLFPFLSLELAKCGLKPTKYAATNRGIPAIAISASNQEVPYTEVTNRTNPATWAAQVSVKFVENFITTAPKNGPLLPVGYGVSVNLPVLTKKDHDPDFVQTRFSGNAHVNEAVLDAEKGTFT
ncbi:hypothetical protein ACKAV7_013111 [Fusarium commune]